MDNIRDLDLLIATHQPIIAIESPEEERVRSILADLAARQDLPLFEWTSTHGLLRLGTHDPLYETEQPLAALKTAANMATEALYLFHDLDKYFDDPAVLRQIREIGESFAADRRALILCSTAIDLPAELHPCTARVRLDLPGLTELKQLAVRTLRDLGAPRTIRVDLSLPELEQLVASLRGLTLQEAQRVLMRAALDDLRLDRSDVQHVLDRKKELIAQDGVLDLLPAEATLQQVGGLQNLKTWLTRRGAAFSAEAERYGLEAPRGILLLGVQGCGKSLCAKAVASAWGLALLRLDAGALYDKFVGESEKNLRRSLATAEAMAPCVMWIDEIEKGMSGRDGAAADGGLSRRILGSFLTWLQDRHAPVFVAATANDIEALPAELLRKGRFDEIFFVDLPGEAARRAILAVHLARRRQDPAAFDLAALSAAAEGFSGAEIEAAIVSALYSAFAERRPLATPHVLESLRSTVPLSRTYRERVEALRTWARDRAVPAEAPDPGRARTDAA